MDIIKTRARNLSLSKQQRRILVSLSFGLVVLFGITAVVFIYREARYQRDRNQGWTYYNTSDVSSLAVDPQGRVWAAQSKHRIVMLQSGAVIRWPEIDASNGVKTEYDEVKTMAFDSAGRLWIRTTNISLAMFDNGKWTIGEPATDDDGVEGRFISQIIVDGHDRVWLSTSMALGKADLSAGRLTYSFQKGDFEPLSGLAVDKRGSLWMLSGNRIRTLNEQDEWVTQTEIENDSGSRLLFIDSTGQAWIGVGNVYRVSTEQHPEKIYEMAGYRVIGIDQQDQIWIGNYRELRKIDTVSDTITSYDALNSGVKDGYPTALVIDPEGRVWVAFILRGVSVLDHATPLAPETVQASLTFTRRYLPAISLGLAVVMMLIAAFLWPSQWQWGRLIYFGLGGIGWFVINSLIWQGILLIEPGPGMSFLAIFLVMLIYLPSVASIITLIVFSLTRRWLALGIIAAIALNSVGILLSVPATDLYSPVEWPLFLMIPFFFATNYAG